MINEIDLSDASDYEVPKYIFKDRKDLVLPGAKKIELTKRNKKIKVEVKSVKFSPDGKFWGAATTEGLHLYSSEDF